MALLNKIMLWISIVLLYCTVANAYALERDENDVVPQKDVESDIDEALQKRAVPLSLNGDLRTLARMLFSQQRRRRMDNFAKLRQQMLDLGKRSGYAVMDTDADSFYTDETQPTSQEQDKVAPTMMAYKLMRPEEFQKRDQRLSINGALSSLADMLAASGRRQLEEELAMNKQRLLKLGRK